MEKKKILVVLLADASTHENMARALHALLYAKQAHEKGADTELIFDGGGVEWAAALGKKEHRLHALYDELWAPSQYNADAITRSTGSSNSHPVCSP